jgi:5-formyltetrahydrofolate cyclo-ligase
MTELSKSTLRQQLLTQRQSLAVSDWQSQSLAICDRLRNLPLVQQSQTILAYVSHRQEADLSPLWGQSSQRWGLPRCRENALDWYEWTGPDCLETGAFGIQAPRLDTPRLAVEQVDLLLVPCVGCDRAGYRLGYGGGFYDRLLAEASWQRIPTIGITFSFGLVEHWPHDPWDRPLNYVLTEQECVPVAFTHRP